MFEQTFVSTPDAKQSPWAFGLSVFTQCGLIVFALAIPLWFGDALPVEPWTRFRIATPPAPPPPEVAQPAARPRAARPERFRPSAFVQPTEIPDAIDLTPDDPPPAANSAPVIPGMAPGTGSAGGAPFGVIGGSNIAAVPKPRAERPPEPAPPAPPKQVRVSGGQQAANLLRRVTPVYPPIARQARIQGTVLLEAVITADGKISQLRTISGHPLLARAAVQAVQQWRYRPHMLSGQPVEVVTTIEVHFRLGR